MFGVRDIQSGRAVAESCPDGSRLAGGHPEAVAMAGVCCSGMSAFKYSWLNVAAGLVQTAVSTGSGIRQRRDEGLISNRKSTAGRTRNSRRSLSSRNS
jgi:hypothetical protein